VISVTKPAGRAAVPSEVNTSELTFWLDWYESLDGTLSRVEDAVVAYLDPDGAVHHAVDPDALPVLREMRELFLRAGEVDVFRPRASSGTQVWPSCWQDEERAAALVRLVEEPAYLAQDGGLRVGEPEAPGGLCRLIDLLEAREFCGLLSRDTVERCPAWARVVPELFRDGMEKRVAEALPCFELLPEEAVRRTVDATGLPLEVMSPFLPYVERPLTLQRLVRDSELVPPQDGEGAADVLSLASAKHSRKTR
jgi:hypothetical protein